MVRKYTCFVNVSLIQHTANRALRCLSISFIAINIIVCSVIRKRRSPAQRKRLALDEIIRLGLLRDGNVIIWCCVGFFQVLSNYVPFTFLPCKWWNYASSTLDNTNQSLFSLCNLYWSITLPRFCSSLHCIFDKRYWSHICRVTHYLFVVFVS